MHHSLSKKKMAKILGISIASVNKIESGIMPLGLRADVLFRIQDYFSISPKEQLERKFETDRKSGEAPS